MSEKRLYRVHVESEFFVVASSDTEAENVARSAIHDEPTDVFSFGPQEVSDDDIATEETGIRSSFPWGDVPRERKGWRVNDWLRNAGEKR